MFTAQDSGGQSRSLWQSDKDPGFVPLGDDAACDVCIVGAGVSGLTTAFELARRGRHVLLLDADGVATGQTARSTAHLVTALDERYSLLSDRYGDEVARAAASAHARAIAWIETVVNGADIPCGFSRLDGTLVVPRHRAGDANVLLARERDAALRAGVDCQVVPVASTIASAFPGSVLRFPGQAQLDPVRYVRGLAREVTAAGGRIHGLTRVVSFHEADGEVRVSTDRGFQVRSKHLVLCTHALPELLRPLLRPIESVVSYVIALSRPASAGEKSCELLWDGYWDEETPYHYVRVMQCGAERGNLLLVGGEDEAGTRPSRAEDAYLELERWTREHFPDAGLRHTAWWGRIMEPQGEFALIGRVPGRDRTFVIAGDSGNGMTYGAIAANRVADMIDGKSTLPIEDAMFDPEEALTAHDEAASG